MIIVNGKIRRNSSPVLTDSRAEVGAVCATRHFQPFPCPDCRDGMVLAAGAKNCTQCRKYEDDQAKAQKTINDLGNANHRAGR